MATRSLQWSNGLKAARLRRAIHRWGTAIGVAVLATAAMITLRYVDPTRPDSALPACPFLSITGLYCPGCGSTRSLHALGHFDVATALAMNPLLVIVLPVLAVLVLNTATARAKLPGLPGRLIADPRVWLWLLVSYWILRNLPWPPFSWLAPGGA